MLTEEIKMKKIIPVIMFILIAGVVAAENIIYELEEYEVYQKGEWELIAARGTENWEREGAINEPISKIDYEVPQDRAIKDVKIVGLSKSVELMANLPKVFYQQELVGFEERTCRRNERKAWISYSDIYDETGILAIEYHPLEYRDCEKGEWTLHRKMEVEVEYYEENKIKSVKHTPFVGDSTATFTLEMENLRDSYLYVYDSISQTVFEGPAEAEMEIEVEIGPFGEQHFFFEVEEDGEIVDRAAIIEDLSWGSVDFRVLVSESRTVFPLAVEITNTKEEAIDVELEIESTDMNFTVQSTMKEQITAKPGNSIHYIDFSIGDDETRNDIGIRAFHNGVMKYAEHNSLIRFTKEEVQAGLPSSPGEQLKQEIAELANDPQVQKEIEEFDKMLEGKEEQPGWSSSLWAGIVIGIVLLVIVGYLGFTFLGVKED